MGKSSNHDRPSLDRLKELNSLPDLSSQLREAKELCNHSARADMILKWTLEKLKKSPEAPCSSEIWELLHSTIRILPPERAAVLLGSSDIFTVVCRGVQRTTEPKHLLLLKVGAFFNLLLDLSKSAIGAPLKAFLSLSSPDAASFAAVWFDHAYQVAAENDEAVTFLSANRLLDPAIQIWELRKQSAEDNEIFATNLLMHVAYLRALLKDSSTGKHLKRNREGAEYSSKLDYASILESLLAKHIFLPERAIFNTPTSTKAVEKSNNLGTLNNQLSALKATAGSKSDRRDIYYKTLPQLLDITIRCIPMQTPKQRLKETPWIEEVFNVLLDCCDVNQENTMATKRSEILTEMLSVVKKRASLSSPVLRNLLNTHSGLSVPDQKVDEQVIAKIVELDASVFVNNDLTRPLFNHVTAVTLRENEAQDASEAMSFEKSSASQALRKDAIIVPIMDAFARERKLSEFVDLWYEQLQHDQHDIHQSIWNLIDLPFAKLMDQSFTNTQILAQFDQFHDNLTAQAVKSSRINTTEVSALLVALRAMLNSVRSDELRDALSERTQKLFEDIQELLEKDSKKSKNGQALPPAVWNVLLLAFEKWFPAWASSQSSSKAVEKKGAKLLASKAVRSAVECSIPSKKKSEHSSVTVKAGRDASVFVVGLCTAFGQYDKCKSASLDLLHELVEKSPVNAREAIIRYPVDTLLLESDEARALISPALPGIQKHPENTLDGARELVDVILSATSLGVGEDVANALVSNVQDEKANAEQMITVAYSSAESLSTDQRGKMVKALISAEDYSTETTLQKCLGLLTRLMTLPLPSIDSWYNTKAFLRLAGLKSSIVIERQETLELLEHVTQLVLKQLLNARDQDLGHSFVLELVKQSTKHLSKVSEKQLGILSVAKTTASTISTSGNTTLIEQGLDSATVKKYVDTVMEATKETAAKDDKESSTTLPALLDALIQAPLSALENEETKQKFEKSLQKIVKKTIRKRVDENDLSPSQSKLVTLVRCFQISCRSISSITEDIESFTKDAQDLIALRLEPREHELILKLFNDTVGKLNGTAKAKVIHELLSQDPTESTFADVLLLLRNAISAVESIDIEGDQAVGPQDILQKLLRIASSTDSWIVCRRACSCVLLALREKPFMINQYIVESVLQTLQGLAKNTASTGAVYIDICRTFTLLLQQHRSRLRDRLHLVVALLQAMISHLFASTRQSTVEAAALARVIQLLCNPPQSRHHVKSSELVDESRRAQAHVGQYVQYALHHYCAQVLAGPAAEGLRDALRPGLWAMIEAIEVNDIDGVKILSSAMNNSERAVLRSVYEDYKALGKWKGG